MKALLFSTVAMSLLIGFSACKVGSETLPDDETISSLRFIGEQIVPNAQRLNGTTIGGLSSIDFRPDNNQFYIIADDPATTNASVRFYTATINLTQNAFTGVTFTGVTSLKQQNGSDFARGSIDPEGLRYDAANQQIIWSSEGLRNTTSTPPVLANPFIRVASLNGTYVSQFSVPALFNIQTTENGTRLNGSFEGLTLLPDNKFIYAASEEPLYEDGPRADVGVSGSPIRIIKFDRQTGQPVAQYAYKLDAVHQNTKPANQFRLNGVVDILSVTNTKMLVMERSFAVGATPDYQVKIYQIDLSTATDVSGMNSLKTATYTPAPKTLLLDVATTGVKRIDNIEGLTFGPKLANGNRTLILVSDDNFNATQITQFLAFEVQP